MEGVRAFLESSTIHGLSYISTTRKLVKIFWILVVITGFTSAGYLIYQSLQHWHDNPVSTTIETQPITEITFPKVTVCPPKNTYTDLNYDLMMTENATIDNNTRTELANYAKELLWDQLHDIVMFNMEKLEDDDRYHNWYFGYNKISPPVPDFNNYDFHYAIATAATSGNISTQYFDDKFDPDKVEKNVNYRIDIIPPVNKQTILNLEIKRVPMKDLSTDTYSCKAGTPNCKREFKDVFQLSLDKSHREEINADETDFTKQYTKNDLNYNRFLMLSRKVTMEDVRKMELKMMPGFMISWHYSGVSVQPKIAYKNTHFVR